MHQCASWSIVTQVRTRFQLTLSLPCLTPHFPLSDPPTKLKNLGEIDQKLDTVIAHFDVDLDGRFTTVRAKESNLGNLITYICDSATDSDCCLINGGTFRSDRIHPKGPFTLRDLQTILPFMDAVVVIEINGKDLLDALEHGVSSYPALDGRFPQVSGLRFAFDKTKPPKQRVDQRLVIVNDEFLDLNKVILIY